MPLLPAAVFVPTMTTELRSKVFSTGTLVEGMAIVKSEEGMDPLTSSDAVAELKALEDLMD